MAHWMSGWQVAAYQFALHVPTVKPQGSPEETRNQTTILELREPQCQVHAYQWIKWSRQYLDLWHT